MAVDAAASRHAYTIFIPGRARLLAVALGALSVAAGLTSWMENTWRLRGLGLSQHFGMLALYATAPFLVLTLSGLATRFSDLLEHPREFRTDNEVVAALIVRAWRAFGGWRDRYLTTSLVIIGMFATLANAMYAQSVMTVYGRDTFDSVFHFSSYYIQHAYLVT